MKKFGPERGTSRYIKQINTIVTQFQTSALTEDDINQFLMLFIMDEEYSRSAICEAESIIRREINEKG